MAAETVATNPNLIPLWHALRILRWLLYLALLAFGLYFVSDRPSHIDQFGQLMPSTELLIFGLGGAPVVVGLFEMMVRDWAGAPRKPPR
jgi:hypothetical protein